MGVRQIPVRREIFAAQYDPAPKLGEILDAISGRAASINAQILADPDNFFERTVITESMLTIFERILDGFEGKSRVFMLQSFFGGGKTHTLLAIFHAFRKPEAMFKSKDLVGARKERAEKIVNRIKELRIADVICFSGDSAIYSGSPLSPTNAGDYAYRTAWGYVAHRLGKYAVMRNYDETLTAPQQDICARMLEGERVLLLFDEVAEYLTAFIGGQYEKYAQAAVTFFEYFAKAVQNSKCVAVFTIPIEKGVLDWRFKNVVVSSLFDAISKVSENFEPLGSGDVVEVLKRRIFEQIPKNLIELTAQKYMEKVSNYPAYFKESYVSDLRRCYPFSPDYVRYLWQLVMDGKLQKTRDVLNITIEVVKRIHESEEDYEVIPFWLVDPGPRLFQEYPEYREIYLREVLSCRNELHRLVLKTIFLATYYYDGDPHKRDMYPSNLDVVRAVYEPLTFSRLNSRPNDVETALSEILRSEEVVHLYYRDDRYWFWKVPSIKEYVEKRARKLLETGDSRIYDKIKEFVKKSYMGTTPSQKERKKERKSPEKELKHGFEDLFFIETSEGYPPDDGKLRLAVVLEKEYIRYAEEMLNYKAPGVERVYRNTTVIVAPGRSQELSWDELRHYDNFRMNAARLVACDEVREEIKTDPAFEENRDVHLSMLDKEKTRIEKDMSDLVVKVYSWIFCPNREPIKVVEERMSLSESVWLTLKDEGKVVDRVDFEYFASLLRTDFGVDIDRDDKNSWEVKKIKEWFRQKPHWPIVQREQIEEMLKNGVRAWRIGILRGEEVFFKRVHQTLPPAKDAEGVVPSELKDSDIVLPRRKAIRRQYEILKEEIRHDYADHTQIIRHVLYPELGGEKIPLSELESLPEWEERFLEGVIVREVLTIHGPDIILRVYPGETVEIREEETARFTIVAEPERFSPEGMEITVRGAGKLILQEAMEIKEKKFEKSLEIVPEKETEKFTVTVIDLPERMLKREKTITVKVRPKVRTVETDTLTRDHLGFKLLKIRNISTTEILETIRGDPQLFGLQGKIAGEIYCKVGDGKLTLKVESAKVDVGVEAALEVSEFGEEKKIAKSFEIILEDGLKISDALLSSLVRLNGKVTFVMEGET